MPLTISSDDRSVEWDFCLIFAPWGATMSQKSSLPQAAKSVSRVLMSDSNLYAAVDVMGEGNVSPNMVSGIEMVQPWGFATVSQALASPREGFETLMSHGV